MAPSNIRRDYLKHELNETDVSQDPFIQFRRWFDECTKNEIPDPTAMTLATAGCDGLVSARIVLLKEFDERGFCFFTNFESIKGKQLEENPNAVLLFFWQQLERQVRIEGVAAKMSDMEADEYFRSRPVGSQLGALASPQSRPIPNREYLESAYQNLEKRFAGIPVPRPQSWGGYRVAPRSIEFWQGRSNRLHDRILYRRGDQGKWIIERLAP